MSASDAAVDAFVTSMSGGRKRMRKACRAKGEQFQTVIESEVELEGTEQHEMEPREDEGRSGAELRYT